MAQDTQITTDRRLAKAYSIITMLPPEEPKRIFRELQRSILEGRADENAQIRRELNQPSDRFEAYARSQARMEGRLFTAAWNCFPEIREAFPSSILANNE